LPVKLVTHLTPDGLDLDFGVRNLFRWPRHHFGF